jgi:hypothetical protein
MKTISGTSIVEDNIKNEIAKKSKLIFTEYLTDYVCLEQNCRAISNNGELSPIALFCRHARKAMLTDTMLSIINQKVVNNEQIAITSAHPKSVWITSTHSKINEINKNLLQTLNNNGNETVRIIATHINKDQTFIRPNEKERDECYNVTGDFKGGQKTPMMTHLDLCIGSRVRLTRNICVEMGLYNGAMGTVHGFVYKNNKPLYNTPITTNGIRTEKKLDGGITDGQIFISEQSKNNSTTTKNETTKTNPTNTTTTNTQKKTFTTKNIIIGVIIVGAVFGFLKYKKII